MQAQPRENYSKANRKEQQDKVEEDPEEAGISMFPTLPDLVRHCTFQRLEGENKAGFLFSYQLTRAVLSNTVAA